MRALQQIFLSHSGHQKGFASDLYNRLCSIGYSVFFDQDHHSLPPGQPFPPLIFSATKTCKLAIVVLSHDFLSSRWPMIELCALADRLSSPTDRERSSDVGVTLLPLFFKISPKDVKNEENMERWRKAWQGFEQKDDRFHASKCERAVVELLAPRKGIIRRPDAEQGEAAYLEEVIKAISATLPPPRWFTISHKKYAGRDRLCQVVLDKFRLLENTRLPSQDSCILGMYGIPGTGKSTLCRFLCDSMFHELSGNVVYLELPTDSDSRADKQSLVKGQCVKLLSKLNPYVKDMASLDMNMVLDLLNHAMCIKKAFLVLDNIMPSNSESYTMILQALLSSAVLGPGSRIMLVSQSPKLLGYLDRLIEDEGYFLKYSYAVMEVPCLTEEEARDVIRNQCPRMKEELRTHLLSKICFPRSSFIYIPFVFEQIGVLFKKFDRCDVEERELLWKMVDKGKRNAVLKLMEMNFKLLPEDLQVLFLDIALFIIPSRYSRLDDATPILARMHGINDTFELIWKINELERHCTLSLMDNQLRVHDIFIEYASTIAGNTALASNVFQPPLSISRTTDPQTVHLKFLEARSVYIALDHYHKDKELNIHVEVRATTKALYVTNPSVYSSKCTIHLSGDLSSLVCFGMENMQQVTLSPYGDDGNLSNLVRLELKRSRSLLLKPLVCPRQFVSNFISSGRMRGLRVLILHDFAGILRTDACPQLEILEVTSNFNKQMDVRIDKAPKLKTFFARCTDDEITERCKVRIQKSRKLAVQVRECPELEAIFVDGWFDQVKIVDGSLPSGWPPRLEVGGCTEIFSSKLQRLYLVGCTMVGRLPFTREHVGCLCSLEGLYVGHCTGLTDLSVEAGCMPNLLCLLVWSCEELQALEGVEDMVMMAKVKFLRLRDLPRLQWACDVMRRPSSSSCQATNPLLERMEVRDCPHVNIYWNVLWAFKHVWKVELKNILIENPILSVAPERFTFLKFLCIKRLHHLLEIGGLEHLCNLETLRLEDMPNLTRLSGAWPATIQCIRFRKFPRLLEVPPLERTPHLLYLEFSKCVRLKAVKVYPGDAEGLEYVAFVGCKSMETFPLEGQSAVMDEWRKRDRREYPDLSVRGSKFANVATMETWMRDAEEGSPLMEAAETALWEHVEKGTPGALDALRWRNKKKDIDNEGLVAVWQGSTKPATTTQYKRPGQY